MQENNEALTSATARSIAYLFDRLAHIQWTAPKLESFKAELQAGISDRSATDAIMQVIQAIKAEQEH